MARPDLSDVTQRAAYRRELMGVAPGVRRVGLALAAIGLIALYLQRMGRISTPAWLPWAILILAFALMLSGIYLRTRYHRQRMRED